MYEERLISEQTYRMVEDLHRQVDELLIPAFVELEPDTNNRLYNLLMLLSVLGENVRNSMNEQSAQRNVPI